MLDLTMCLFFLLQIESHSELGKLNSVLVIYKIESIIFGVDIQIKNSLTFEPLVCKKLDGLLNSFQDVSGSGFS